jgi:hypothetical protein
MQGERICLIPGQMRVDWLLCMPIRLKSLFALMNKILYQREIDNE